MRFDIHALIGETTAYDKKQQIEAKRPKSWLKSVSAFANGEGGNAECAYNHFLAQTSEKSIALAGEVFELHWRARCLLVVVHRCFLKIN